MAIATQDCDPALPVQLQRKKAIAYALGTLVQLTITDLPRTSDQRGTICAMSRKIGDLVEQTTGVGHQDDNSPESILLTYTPSPGKTMLNQFQYGHRASDLCLLRNLFPP